MEASNGETPHFLVKQKLQFSETETRSRVSGEHWMVEERGPRENAVKPERSEGVSLKRRNAAFLSRPRGKKTTGSAGE